MLVIINPVATKMSERVRGLVVYALQGRYDVTTRATEAKGHAIELSREAAAEGYDVVVAFGGDGTVNEAANGLAGSTTALTVSARAAPTTSSPSCSASPPTSSTRPSTCCTSRTAGRRARSTSASSTAATSRSRRAWGSTRRVVERVDRNPRLKKRFGPFYFVECAIVTFLRKYVVHPPRLRSRSTGARSAASPCSSRTPRTTPTSTTARCRWSRARASTRAAWPASS